MDFKSEKGFTGVDIAISIVVIFIFTSIIAILVYNINASTKDLERKSEAMSYAIDAVEEIKRQGFSSYMDKSIKNNNNLVEDKEEIKVNEKTIEGYYRTINVIDYSDMEGMETKIPGLVKKITVTISYMSRGKEQSVDLSIILSKGN